ncbi:uncharacterized protein LOC110661990 isoform X1 [Hevea brasiliensis]|uniref:uncharacterized protein LOC110661990 isoform X1 n=1 Tax=Hevea brasiliensis TaxID=3981 RepID=UPI0025E28AB8|nr:uncharacterized protein LOC110661990 isoform X1 [Hevea brasiliensis]XP_057988825.1 uncharacterized protein LOC110661990 isoform X1 [Hevea brasiliensis]XP_057988826.1 uncharacterized protein LOC110661990 isoform X1 [Hevea brasiliensis]XP_057988827.1 uncharacterized protein LOC110661990 isoform X1 [Hevea brasiliensis]
MQLHDQLQLALADETKSLNHVEKKSGKEYYMLKRPSHVSPKIEETVNGGRKSNLSGTFDREEDRSRFSANIVLALQATSFRPERELPLKKRRYRRLKIERMEAGKEAKASVMEGNADTTTMPEQEAKKDTTSMLDNLAKTETALMPEKENLSECDGSQRSKSINCLLNQESSLPSPIIYGLQGQESGENLFQGGMPNEYEGKQKRRRGPPKKATRRRSKEAVGMRRSKYFPD